MAKNKRLSKKVIYGLVIALLLLSSVVTYKLILNTKNSGGQNTGSSANVASATEAEKQETDQHKQELSNDTPDTLPTGNDGKKQVTPVISYADKTTVSAYITGIFEEGGTCTANLTSGSKTITKTSVGFQNASYTQCAPIDLTGSALGSDTWSVTVSYSSATATGKSDPATIKP